MYETELFQHKLKKMKLYFVSKKLHQAESAMQRKHSNAMG